MLAGKAYKIVQYGNGEERIFLERENYIYFQKLMLKHLAPVCEILKFELLHHKIELELHFRQESEISEKYRGKLYMPISNLLNSYAKSINKRYNRSGSLFRRRFERIEINIKDLT